MAEYPARRMLGEQPLPSDPAAAVTPPPLGPAASAEGRGQRRRTARNGPARPCGGAEGDGEGGEEEGAARLPGLRSLRLPRETRPSAGGRARRPRGWRMAPAGDALCRLRARSVRGESRGRTGAGGRAGSGRAGAPRASPQPCRGMWAPAPGGRAPLGSAAASGGGVPSPGAPLRQLPGGCRASKERPGLAARLCVILRVGNEPTMG